MNFSSLLKGAAAALALASVVTLTGCGGDKDAASSAAKSQAAGSKTYIVATRGTFRPFTYVDEKGNLTGYDVEILKEVEKRNPGIHFEYKMMPTSAAFVAIESGQADIVANQSDIRTKEPQRRSIPRKSTTTPPERLPSGMTGTILTALKI